MAKSGDDYQELVAAVQRAFDPGAKVEIGIWVEGPDGRRDMDVAVRGTTNGTSYFALVECKDWQDKVGIAVVDAFDSKLRDLSADLGVIFSSSGFTRDAERKARRVGIGLASALKDGDPLVKMEILRTFIARRRVIKSWAMTIFGDRNIDGPGHYHPFDVTFKGLPVVNWIHQDSLDLLRSYSDAPEIKAEYAFDGEQEFFIRGAPFKLIGLVYQVTCETDWVSQSVRERVSLGSYDFLKKCVMVPDKQTYMLGPFNNVAWEPSEAPPPADEQLEPGTFRIGVTLLCAVNGIDGVGVPAIDSIIRERLITPLDRPDGRRAV